MSENNSAPTSVIAALNGEVAEALKTSGAGIRETVKQKFITDEVNRRAELLLRLVVAINNFRKEGFKIKADLVSYNAEGGVANEGWSKPQLDKRKKFTEKMEKAEKVFEKAVNESDFSQVEAITKELSAAGPVALTNSNGARLPKMSRNFGIGSENSDPSQPSIGGVGSAFEHV